MLVAACTDDGATSPTVPPTAVTTTTVPSREHDGILRIGVLLPSSGDGAAIGQPLINATIAAGQAVNDAGGVLGNRIQIITGFDEGDDPDTAREAVASLLERDVDAVVGPASSTTTLAALADLLNAGVLTCSPTATALALDSFPDRELFFRTAPSDSLQALAIALTAERTGALAATVVFLDDAYGRPLADATIAALRTNGLTVEDPIGFTSDDPILVDEAASVHERAAGVVVIIADGEQGSRMLTALNEASGVDDDNEAATIILNDAIRRPPSPAPIAALAPEMRENIIGLSPMTSSGDADEPAGAFATNAVDCVNLIALAAAEAETDDPEAIAAGMVDVSEGGVSCSTFAECIALVNEGRNVDYDGPGGNLQIGADGDAARYRFDRWMFDENGVDVSLAVGAVPVPR